MEVVQDEHPATLNKAGQMQTLLTLRVVKELVAGQQILCNYGDSYWGAVVADAGGTIALCTPTLTPFTLSRPPCS